MFLYLLACNSRHFVFPPLGKFGSKSCSQSEKEWHHVWYGERHSSLRTLPLLLFSLNFWTFPIYPEMSPHGGKTKWLATTISFFNTYPDISFSTFVIKHRRHNGNLLLTHDGIRHRHVDKHLTSYSDLFGFGDTHTMKRRHTCCLDHPCRDTLW